MRFRPGQHLRRQSEIRAVREQGSRIECRAFTLWWHSTGSAAAPRVAVVASIQAVGHAVLRTRAKRRLRELFRRHQNLVPSGCDLLLVARLAVNRWQFMELERSFSEACSKIPNPGRPKLSPSSP
jgi:ribonuclease P protein component